MENAKEKTVNLAVGEVGSRDHSLEYLDVEITKAQRRLIFPKLSILPTVKAM